MTHSFTQRIMPRVLLALAYVFFVSLAAVAQTDPLPSWNEGATKAAILDFVNKVTTDGAPDFVPVAERIAVFDMDGTLVPEKPVPIAAIPLEAQLKAAIAADPSVKDQPAIKALLAHDLEAFSALGEAGVAQLVAAVTGGQTVEEAAAQLREAMAAFRHPKFDRPVEGLVYQPMRELIEYLGVNGFEVWISSGSPVLFTRQFSEAMFGIPPEHVMGTAVKTEFAEREGRSVLVFRNEIEHINDMETKPVTINGAVGKRPLLVGGNVMSHGDIAMMRYSKDREGPSLQLLINHDDADREYAYAEKDGASLADAAKYGFHVISMKNDWARILSDAP